MNDTERTVFARMMEVYAGFAEHTDAQVMRLIDTLDELGLYDDTIFIYIAGDNGASAEGGLDGTFNELMALNGIPQTLEDVVPRLVRYHFDFGGGQPGSGGTGRIYVNDQLVAEGRIDKTVPFVFSADETMDIGGDSAMPVTDDYAEGEKNRFTGDITWVRIDLEDDDVSHLEPEDAKYHRVLARQ